MDIIEGELLATFTRTNILDLDIAHMSETTESDNTVSARERRDTIAKMSEQELNNEISSLKHLKDLDIASATKRLTMQQRMRLKRLILTYNRLWDTTPKQVPTTVQPCSIQLCDKVKRFEHQARYTQLNPNSQKQLRDLIETKLKRGVIEPSTSACSSSVLLVPKPNGGVRFCIDYRALNKAIKNDAYTLPTVSENLANLSGNHVFSSLDMKEAFWNVPLTQESKELTAFRTPDGLYMYKRMPMGLKTASAVFCRYIDKVLGDLKWASILVYIDDLLVATPTFDEHASLLEKLFERLNAANITLGAKKCFIARPEVSFLGHVVSAKGLEPQPDKVKAIYALDTSKMHTPKDLKSALGIMGYYRRFIANYAAIAEPLRKRPF